MPLQSISPEAARDLVSRGAVLIDIRSADEYARARIDGARHLPLADLSGAAPLDAAAGVIFHCRSGQRTRMHAPTLSASTSGQAYVLDGGLDAWKKAGFAVVKDAAQPIELQRQVHIAAGSLSLAGAVLGFTVSPWFHVVSGVVGAGLVLAGVTGFCGMALVLARMPWNRKALSG